MIHNLPRFTRRLLPIAALLAALLPTSPLHAAPFAYVPNEGSGTVSVIDTASDLVVAQIAAGTKPRGLAAGLDRRWLYVSDQPNNRLQLIDLAERKPAGTVDLGESPEGVSISSDGRWVVAAVEGKNDIAVTDTRTNTLAFTIPVRG